MVYTITNNSDQINWYSKGDERIIQNVKNLISTFRYEIPYDRTNGINKDLLHNPIEMIQAELISDVVDLIATYEPRATVIEVKILSYGLQNGEVNLEVVVEI